MLVSVCRALSDVEEKAGELSIMKTKQLKSNFACKLRGSRAK
ncbi:hypothetical protein A0O36_01946 [Piscirickettsiaceae bacterium NZ-RLO1]|nr:hypothetical protein A0O36_01946 [Piscirickettsiaceae bacterium NZ-RLO1]